MVYGTGQPTKEGFKNALQKIFECDEAEVKKVLWTNMRQVGHNFLCTGVKFVP